MRSDDPHSREIVNAIERVLESTVPVAEERNLVLVDWVVVACWLDPIAGEYEYRRLMLPDQPPHRVEGMLRKGLEQDWEESDA